MPSARLFIWFVAGVAVADTVFWMSFLRLNAGLEAVKGRVEKMSFTTDTLTVWLKDGLPWRWSRVGRGQ